MGFSNSGVYWIVSSNGNGIYAAGDYSFYLISFDKEKMEGMVSTLINTDLKVSLVSKFIKNENIFVLGNGGGQVIFINLNEIKFPEGYTFKIVKEIF